MNKHLKIWLCIVMAAAVALMSLCTVEYLSLGSQLRDSENLLAESRAAWERIAADKVEIQKELKAKKENLKEAELTLSESAERAEELRTEIELLKQEIETLKNTAD